MKKILLSSSPNGNFDLLIPKVSELHNKNKFDLMLIVGRVFPSESAAIFKKIVEGELTIPLPIYFIDYSDMSGVWAGLYPNGHTLAPNLHYLGNVGLKAIQGLKIAYFSGICH